VDSTNPLGSSASPFVFWNPNFGTTGGYDLSYTPENPMTGPGTTLIRIIDALGCTASDTIFITQPDLLQITDFDTLTYSGGYNVSCYGCSDGELTINTIGGTPNYTYWLQDTNSVQNPLSTNPLFDSLAPSYYKAFVIDDHGCVDSLVFYLTQPDPNCDLTTTVTILNATSSISCDGFVFANTTSSYSPVDFSWYDSSFSLITSGTHFISNLCFGVYFLQSYDNVGCFVVDTFFIGDLFGCTDPTSFNFNPLPLVS
jgi:hypothetical protein